VYAVVRETLYDADRLTHASSELDEFQRLHAAQPGYKGNVVVDTSDGRRITLTLWASEAHSSAARLVLEPEVRRLLTPLMAAPSRIIGVGLVVTADVTSTAAGTPLPGEEPERLERELEL
jgi:polynucleotide 5'-kinase involved in rRNA processing